MTDTPSTTRITEVGTVFVPVTDQDRALEFYVGTLGFEKRVDFVYGEEGLRWIEVAPPGAANTISLVPPGEGSSAGGDEAHCAFATTDIEADHALPPCPGRGRRRRDRARRGAPIGADLARRQRRRSVPAQFFFRDPDGNRFLLVAASARTPV